MARSTSCKRVEVSGIHRRGVRGGVRGGVGGGGDEEEDEEEEEDDDGTGGAGSANFMDGASCVCAGI